MADSQEQRQKMPEVIEGGMGGWSEEENESQGERKGLRGQKWGIK